MLKLIGLELTKVKRTSMGKIIIALTILPAVLIMLQYVCLKDENKEFYNTVAKNNVILTMCLYTVLIIFSNYIFSREYQDKTGIYLFITPVSKRSIFLAKFAVIFIELYVLSGFSYGITLILNAVFGGVTADVVKRMVLAWLAGGSLFFLLMPFIVAIAIWKKNFISSMLISLVLLIFTTPFMFTGNFYLFPHLIPMAIGNNFLRIEGKMDINYGLAFAIMIAVFVVFSVLALRLFEKKE